MLHHTQLHGRWSGRRCLAALGLSSLPKCFPLSLPGRLHNQHCPGRWWAGKQSTWTLPSDVLAHAPESCLLDRHLVFLRFLKSKEIVQLLFSDSGQRDTQILQSIVASLGFVPLHSHWRCPAKKFQCSGKITLEECEITGVFVNTSPRHSSNISSRTQRSMWSPGGRESPLCTREGKPRRGIGAKQW